MRELSASRFSSHVHEVVSLSEQGASLEVVGACIDALHLEDDEQAALWQLALSLHSGPVMPAAPRALSHA